MLVAVSQNLPGLDKRCKNKHFHASQYWCIFLCVVSSINKTFI